MCLPSAPHTHRFHTQTPVSGQQPNGLPSASYCCWSGFVFVFDGLTFVHKAQEDSCSPGTDTHTHKLTLAPSWRVPLRDPGHLLQLLSEPWCHYEETQCLFIIPPPPIDTHIHNLTTTQTHIHTQATWSGALEAAHGKVEVKSTVKQVKVQERFKWMIYASFVSKLADRCYLHTIYYQMLCVVNYVLYCMFLKFKRINL